MSLYKQQIYKLWMNGNILLDSGYRAYFELFVYEKPEPLRFSFTKESDGRISTSNSLCHQKVVFDDLHTAVERCLANALACIDDDCYVFYGPMFRLAANYVNLIKLEPMLF
jgi:hypothetical protein